MNAYERAFSETTKRLKHFEPYWTDPNEIKGSVLDSLADELVGRDMHAEAELGVNDAVEAWKEAWPSLAAS